MHKKIEFAYGVDGYMCEPTRSDNNIADLVSRACDGSESEEAGVGLNIFCSHWRERTRFSRY